MLGWPRALVFAFESPRTIAFPQESPPTLRIFAMLYSSFATATTDDHKKAGRHGTYGSTHGITTNEAIFLTHGMECELMCSVD